MNSKVNELLNAGELRSKIKSCEESDEEIRSLISNMEIVERYLRTDQLYTGNSRALRRLLAISFLLLPTFAFAGDPVTIVNNFVNVLIGRVFPVMALGYFAHALMLFIKDDPTAKTKIVNVVLSSSFLIGINGVWRFIQSQAN